MSKKIFTSKEIDALAANPYVKSVSPKGITYTDEFKELFIAQTLEGKFPVEIFRGCGFDVEVLGERRMNSCKNRWTRAYRKDGVMGCAIHDQVIQDVGEIESCRQKKGTRSSRPKTSC